MNRSGSEFQNGRARHDPDGAISNQENEKAKNEIEIYAVASLLHGCDIFNGLGLLIFWLQITQFGFSS